MIAYIEALAALADEGTMGQAGTRLRITQSAVSKRIAALETELDRKLVERHGRRLKLTPAGVRLLEKAGPLITALKQAAQEERAPEGGRLVLGVSESLLSSWVPPLLERVQAQMPHLDLVLNAHRSPVAIERVRAGEYMLALCAGIEKDPPDLMSFALVREPMVLVPSGLKRLKPCPGAVLPVITIEPSASTWSGLQHHLRRSGDAWGLRLEITRTLQSFTCIAQLARAGFGHGLVPLGVAKAMGIADGKLFRFPAPDLTRPIGLVARPTTMALPQDETFCTALRHHTPQEW